MTLYIRSAVSPASTSRPIAIPRRSALAQAAEVDSERRGLCSGPTLRRSDSEAITRKMGRKAGQTIECIGDHMPFHVGSDGVGDLAIGG